METLGQPEQEHQQLEVLHFKEEDVVLSPDIKMNRIFISELPGLLSKIKTKDSPAYDFAEGRTKENTFILDSEGSEDYFVKQKYFASPEIHRAIKDRLF